MSNDYKEYSERDLLIKAVTQLDTLCKQTIPLIHERLDSVERIQTEDHNEIGNLKTELCVRFGPGRMAAWSSAGGLITVAAGGIVYGIGKGFGAW